MRFLFAVSLLIPVSASASLAPPCVGSPGDSGPISFAAFSAPGFACQQQDKAYSDFTFAGLPADATLRFTFNTLAGDDFHTVSFAGNFDTAFSVSYTIGIDPSISPLARIDLVAADLSSSIPVGNPTLQKLVQTLTFVDLGTTVTTRTAPGTPLMVNQIALRITDAFTPNGGVATAIGNTFRQELEAIPEPATVGLAGGALLLLALLSRRKK